MSTFYQNSTIKTLLKFLDKVYGAVGDYKEDDIGFVKCLYFQDSFMKDLFNFYPDRLCLDCIYQHFEVDLFMYTFFCEDSNGRSYIIAIGFLLKNDVESLMWLTDTFKKHNPNWRKMKLIAIDPSIRPREIIKEAFPQPLMIMCFFHAFITFQNDINNMKAVSDEQKIYVIDLFRKLFYAPSVAEFQICYQQFLDLGNVFVTYLLENWMIRQEEWRFSLDFIHEDIFLNINAFLEDYRGIVKSLFVEKNSVEFIKKLFLIVSLKKKEKPTMFLQPVSFLYSRFSPEYQISNVLTPYAAKFVIQQLDLSSEIHAEMNPLSDTYEFAYLGMSVSVSSTACSCHFYLLTSLPCRHIFAVRKINYLCVFDESLVDYTWNMKYYEHTLTCVQGYLHHNTHCCIPQDVASRESLASHLFEISVPQLLELPKEIYESRVDTLRKLIQAWKVDEDVSLQFDGLEKNIIPAEISCPGPSNTPNKNEDLAILNEVPDPEQFASVASCRTPRNSLFNFSTSILDGNQINLAYVCCVICATKESCIDWLWNMEFLSTSMKCPSCNTEMISKNISRLSDGVVWSCPKIGENKKCCSKRSSVRHGSWFEQANMTLEQILIFIYLWINGFSKHQIISETGITSSNYVMLDKFHHRVCEESLNGCNTLNDQVSTSGCENPLDEWLEKKAGDDHFVQFLKDAAIFYQKNAGKNFTLK